MPSTFHIVDVFSRRPFAGNPVAVVIASDEDEMTMQRIAGWTGLPETVFASPPGSAAADYALRIFSPVRELAFAGHPSIGACHTLLELGLVVPRDGIVTQECPAGLVDMRVEGSGDDRRIAFTVFADEPAPLPADARAALGEALGATPASACRVQAGAPWIVARFETAAQLAALRPSFERVRRLADAMDAFGVSAYAPSPEADADVEVRSFAPSLGVDEDAVCGSGNACVAAAIAHERQDDALIAALTVSQGRHRGRDGRVRLIVSRADRRIMVSGEAVTTASGRLALDGKPPRDTGDVRTAKAWS